MNLNDGDLELIFALYDSAHSIVPDKEKSTLAEDFVRHLVDFGFDVKRSANEIAEHCEYLEAVVDDLLDSEEVFDEESTWGEEEDEDYNNWDD